MIDLHQMFKTCEGCETPQYCATVTGYCPIRLALEQGKATFDRLYPLRAPASEGEQK